MEVNSLGILQVNNKTILSNQEYERYNTKQVYLLVSFGTFKSQGHGIQRLSLLGLPQDQFKSRPRRKFVAIWQLTLFAHV